MLTAGPDAVSSPDNGSAYRATIHALACKALGIRHLRTRPYRPRTNGKAERFIRTMLGGWAYGAIYGQLAANARRPRRLARLLQSTTTTRRPRPPTAASSGCRRSEGTTWLGPTPSGVAAFKLPPLGRQRQVLTKTDRSVNV